MLRSIPSNDSDDEEIVQPQSDEAETEFFEEEEANQDNRRNYLKCKRLYRKNMTAVSRKRVLDSVPV